MTLGCLAQSGKSRNIPAEPRNNPARVKRFHHRLSARSQIQNSKNERRASMIFSQQRSERMSLTIAPERLPLAEDEHGVMRVGGTRVTLDTVVGAFNDGASAEDIISMYPSLDLADVYAVIAYYLRRRADVDAYLRRREEEGAAIRSENEARFDPHGVRERLLARRAARQS